MRPLFISKCCGRQPEFKNKRDQFTLTVIWRAQLDMMCAREPHTVATNWARVNADYDMTIRHLSVLPESLLPQLGSAEVRDRVGRDGGSFNDPCFFVVPREKCYQHTMGHNAEDKDVVEQCP